MVIVYIGGLLGSKDPRTTSVTDGGGGGGGVQQARASSKIKSNIFPIPFFINMFENKAQIM